MTNQKNSSRTKKRDRRQFLQNSSRILASSLVLPLVPGALRASSMIWAEPVDHPVPDQKQRALVVIFLRGGADALNIVVPYTNKTYHAVRPRIAVPEVGAKPGQGVIKLTNSHGLHPALAPLKPFWDRKMLSAILSVGSPHPTRSHFDAQDFMEYGAPGNRILKDGWLNRYLAETHKQEDTPMRALAMQGLLPRALRGRQAVLAVPQMTRKRSEGLLDLFDDVYRGGGGESGGMTRPEGRDAVLRAGRSTIEVLRKFWDITEKTPGAKKGIKYPRGGFGARLATLAKVIRNGCGLEIAAIDLTSWDHHQGEGNTDGAINRRLALLGQGLGAFAEDLGPALQNVTVLVMSEFGRNVAENGNRGTDHGRGGCMLALGGNLANSRIIGTYGSLKPKDLYDGRDLNVDIDYRQVFTETLQGVFGFKPQKSFFPKWSPGRSLGLMKS